jgi:hypothetical protein
MGRLKGIFSRIAWILGIKSKREIAGEIIFPVYMSHAIMRVYGCVAAEQIVRLAEEISKRERDMGTLNKNTERVMLMSHMNAIGNFNGWGQA